MALAVLVAIVSTLRRRVVAAGVRHGRALGAAASGAFGWAARRFLSGRRSVVASRASGAALVLAGAAMVGWTGAGGTGGVGTLPLRLVVADPGCTATSPQTTGVNAVCLHEAHEGATAGSGDFTSSTCDHGATVSSTQDTFVFVIPQFGDPDRVFTTPAPSVIFDTGTVAGIIDSSNPMFFIASAPVGSVLEEASAHADNGSGTPSGGPPGEDQPFNLTHICFAPRVTTTTSTPGTMSTHTISTTTTAPGTTVTTTTTTTAPGTTVTVTESASASTVTTTEKTTLTIAASTVTTTSTAPGTTVTTTSTVPASTVTSTVTTTSTARGSASTQTVTKTVVVTSSAPGSTVTTTSTAPGTTSTRTVTQEEEETRTVTHEEEETRTVTKERTTIEVSPTTVTQSGRTVTTTVTASGGVAAVSTSSTPPAAVAPAAIPPKTGADVPFLVGFVLLLSGLSLLGWSLRRTAKPIR
jgi:hypothetical protein